MTTGVGSIFSAEDLLARSKAAVESRGSTTGMSKIQQMLADRESGDTVELSPVARLLQARQAEQSRAPEPYTEQEWFINAKVAQLRGQIELYSNLPGLDPSGEYMKALEKEVIDLVRAQQKKIAAADAEAKKKQAELDAIEQERLNAPLSADELLKRAKLRAEGKPLSTELSAEVKKLLENSEKLVNKTV